MTDHSAPDPNPLATAAPRPRRNVTLVDRWVRAPLGLLWLGVLLVIGVPIAVYMTLLCYAARLVGAGASGRGARAPGITPTKRR
jgi:hypothetical protein